MNIVLSLHVVAAIFLLGPLIFATSATPRAVRTGGADTLRFLARTTRIYAYGSVVVLLLGAANVQPKYHYSFGQTWLWLSVVLFVIALGLIIGLVMPAQRRALQALETGADGAGQLPMIAALSGIAALLFAVITVLMVYKPGMH